MDEIIIKGKWLVWKYNNQKDSQRKSCFQSSEISLALFMCADFKHSCTWTVFI